MDYPSATSLTPIGDGPGEHLQQWDTTAETAAESATTYENMNNNIEYNNMTNVFSNGIQMKQEYDYDVQIKPEFHYNDSHNSSYSNFHVMEESNSSFAAVNSYMGYGTNSQIKADQELSTDGTHMYRQYAVKEELQQDSDNGYINIEPIITKSEPYDENSRDYPGAPHTKETPDKSKAVNPEARFACKTCTEVFTTSQRLYLHKKRAHPWDIADLPYKCHLCSAGCRWERNLKRHLKTHHGISEDTEIKPGTASTPGVAESNLSRVSSSSSLTSMGENSRQSFDNIKTEAGLPRPQPVSSPVHVVKMDDDASPSTAESTQHQCPICSKSFRFKSVLNLHITRNHTNKDNELPCPVCSEAFQSVYQLEKHIQGHTEKKEEKQKGVVCPICQESFEAAALLEIHMHNHTQNMSFKCDICNETFSSQFILVRHKATHSADKGYPCGQCSKTFKNRANLTQHMRMHSNELKFNCTPCSKSFRYKPSLDAHLKSLHHQKVLNPDLQIPSISPERQLAEYPETMLPPEYYEEHSLGGASDISSSSGMAKAVPGDSGVHTCLICQKEFTRRQSLTIHLALHSRKHTCNECGKAFSTSSYLQQHLVKHTPGHQETVTCSTCGKTFATQSRLKQHMLVHSDVRSYRCIPCNKSFRYKTSLDVHLNAQNHYEMIEKLNQKGEEIVDIERPHKCTVCDKSFTVKMCLTKHMQQHMGEQYHCETCGKGFREKSRLKQHMISHTRPPKVVKPKVVAPKILKAKALKAKALSKPKVAERPHNCPECSRSFTTKVHLKQHQQSHETAKAAPVECKICGMSFRKTSYLRMHMRKHKGAKVYTCTICSQSFTQYQYLQRHKRNHAVASRPHTCQVCSMGFNSDHSLERHMKVKHPNDKIIPAETPAPPAGTE